MNLNPLKWVSSAGKKIEGLSKKFKDQSEELLNLYKIDPKRLSDPKYANSLSKEQQNLVIRVAQRNQHYDKLHNFGKFVEENPGTSTAIPAVLGYGTYRSIKSFKNNDIPNSSNSSIISTQKNIMNDLNDNIDEDDPAMSSIALGMGGAVGLLGAGLAVRKYLNKNK